jgi:dihydrofolate reductase
MTCSASELAARPHHADDGYWDAWFPSWCADDGGESLRNFPKRTWLAGGGDLVGQFYDAGLLDQIILGMTPVALGKGAPLLPRRITSEHLSFRKAESIGQRLRVVLGIG